ncbi:MAG: NADH-quinone oxidoreductase subunit L, partial [Campylobacter sp.]|nr:NADH-quinone oxidoreductase subunit L [Campylobacter sp.]
LALIALSTLFAIYAYKKKIFKESLSELKFYKILKNSYFIPQFYDKAIIANYANLAKLCRKTDEAVIDKSIDGVSNLINAFAFNADKMQSGDLSRMLRLMVTGFAILLSFIFLLAGGA